MDAPAQTSLAPWFGGKRTMAPAIVAQLGPHRSYWEPFCGSLAVLLNKPPASHETANDLHGDLVNLARVVQDERLGRELYASPGADAVQRGALPRVARRAVTAAPAEGACGPVVERAYHYFLVSWMGPGGLAGIANTHQSFAKRYDTTGGRRPRGSSARSSRSPGGTSGCARWSSSRGAGSSCARR
jgi:DNA adenine methylase